MKINRPLNLKILIAEAISWLFFPPLVSTVFFVFLIFWYSADFSQGLKWIVFVSPFLIFIPLIFFLVSYRLGWISDIDFSDRRERPIFLSVFIGMMAIASLILYLLKVPIKFFVYVFSGLVMVTLQAIITLFWKISFHTAATTSVVTAINILGGLKFWPLYLLIPPVAWARVVLKKHSLNQVIGGALVAFTVTVIIFYLFGFHFFNHQ